MWNFVSSKWFRFLGLDQCCLQFKCGYVFWSLFIFFLRILYPVWSHITSFFFSSHSFPELFYIVLRWCFFYYNFVFPYFSIEFFGIHQEDLILPVEFFAGFVQSVKVSEKKVFFRLTRESQGIFYKVREIFQ